jgi:hypothetical protein
MYVCVCRERGGREPENNGTDRLILRNWLAPVIVELVSLESAAAWRPGRSECCS